MRNILLFCAFLLPILPVQAQTLPNPDFENWSIIPYYEPGSYWVTSNIFSMPENKVVTVSKVAGHMSNNAIRIETKVVGTDTIGSFVTNSLADVTNGEGGMPYTGKPTSFNGYYRYSLATGDTALVLIAFKKNGSVISQDIFKIAGGQATFAPFSLPLSVPTTPDSVIIAMTSSNIIDWINVSPGSWIEFDSVEFKGVGLMPALTNGNFEHWDNVTYQAVDGWEQDGEIERTTVKNSGNYAIKLTSEDDGSGYVYPADISVELPMGSVASTLNGYYRYITPGSDSGRVLMIFTDINGMPVGTTLQLYGPTGGYTPFSIPIDDTSNKAKNIYLSFSSSHGLGVDGSVLYLDNLEIKPTIGIKSMNASAANVLIYPNPAKDKLNIAFKNGKTGEASVTIADTRGSIVYSNVFRSIDNNTLTIPVSNLVKGMYFYTIKTNNEVLTDKFIKE